MRQKQARQQLAPSTKCARESTVPTGHSHIQPQSQNSSPINSNSSSSATNFWRISSWSTNGAARGDMRRRSPDPPISNRHHLTQQQQQQKQQKQHQYPRHKKLQRPIIHFPSAPKHMPMDEHLMAIPGPSRQPHELSIGAAAVVPWDIPNDYSYAYYEPGPPKKHTNVPNRYPGGAGAAGSSAGHANAAYREGSYKTKHTYLTRYGTEENIYEEISDLTRARLHAAQMQQLQQQQQQQQQPNQQNQQNQQTQQSILSLNQSLVEEEVRRVQSGHRRVLGELNLSVEAMLMPNSREGSDDTDRENDDQLADLLSVGPTDELLSPAPLAVDLDSGFSGSSSGASYRSAAGSLRKNGAHRLNCGAVSAHSKSAHNVSATGSVGCGVHSSGSGGKGFWGRKAWKKLAGGLSNHQSTTTKQNFGCAANGAGILNDEPRVRPGAGAWEEAVCERRVAPQLVRTLHHSVSQRSSEDSWCSGSDAELSSEEESDRSAASSTRANGQLRNTLNKARTLCDKWRSSGGIGSNNRLSLDASPVSGGDTSPQNAAANQQGRLSRWFSIRRGSAHQYDIENCDLQKIPHNQPSGGGALMVNNVAGSKMPLLPELAEEEAATFAAVACSQFQQRRQVPPSLPQPPPPNLTPQQLKRRMIVAAIVHSENSYVSTLQRLVNDYKKPLEESSPAILSSAKINTLFHRLSEILQCHTLFRIALAESVRNWDRDEKIGDVFVASFSKAIVLDIYSGFINNFSIAMDLAKMEAKRKSALADFLKVKQISSHDRLSFFGLMVKPVQRFPQFILFLQDLLKHTPQGHHDRMSLQLALTQLESLAEMLNERKREAEQFQAFKEMLRNISGKFSARPLSDGNRYLLREDNVTQLEFNQCGMITKTKSRRLLLLNDLVVCVSVAPKSTDDFGAGERLSLKWTFPVSDIEIQDTSMSPTLSRILTAGLNRGGSLKSNSSFEGSGGGAGSQAADGLCSEMSSLMHDYEVMSRIADLAGTLKCSYQDVNYENAKRVCHQIQYSIQKKDEEMAWVDSCCLQLVAKTKGKEEVFTFQTDNPSVKKEWITELRLAQLALDPNNSPAWEVPEQEQRPSTKMPLFVKSQRVFKSQHQTEVRCGCYYTVTSLKPTRRRGRTQCYLWVCTSDGASSHISILAQHQQHTGSLKDIASFSLVETQITCIEFVKGLSPGHSSPLSSDLVWMGTDSRRLLIYLADEPERQEQVGCAVVPDIITQIKYYCDSVFVALGNGSLLIYRRNSEGDWSLKDPHLLSLGSDEVSCLLPINLSLYAACGKKVWVLNGLTGEVQKSFSIQHEHVGNVNLMAHSGIGLWISLKNSSTICLYHTETFKHLQDINIASNVVRVTSGSGSNCCMNNTRSQVNVTALLACKGLLWVGTNVGISLTIPLPRLEGVPIISGRVNISYHAHFGPISFLLALQPKNYYSSISKLVPKEDEPPSVTTKHENQEQHIDDIVEEHTDITPATSTPADSPSTNKLKHQLAGHSPVVLRRKRSKDNDISRLSKTLPRNLGHGSGSVFSTGSTSSHSSGDTCDVYGLYGELMYIKDYEGDENILTDPIYESLRRSDPELAAIPAKVSTLDRRLKMKVSRPRSLDLSNWSVDSRSSSLYTSSGSEESMAMRNNHNGGTGGGSHSVSRNNSNASRQLNDVCENSVLDNTATKESEVENQKQQVSVVVNKVKSKTLQRNGTMVGGENSARRTVITIMGGRGYINWRQPCCTTEKLVKNSFTIREPNSNDAHLVIWELKL